ncbi:unnamed protein product [Cunninghamella blakesleeana]
MASICNRHKLHKNENKKTHELTLYKDLTLLPNEQQQSIVNAWDIFNTSSSQQRLLILKGLLSTCCTSQLSYLWDNVQTMLRTDFTLIFPTEVVLRIFTHLDAQSLCVAAQVNKRWQVLANDDSIWHRLCEQHIDKKCAKCGWGLPLLQKRKVIRVATLPIKRSLEEDECEASAITTMKNQHRTTSTSTLSINTLYPQPKRMDRKPWKTVYSERLVVERNWRKHQAKTIHIRKAHKESILTMAFCEAQSILMTGSKDKTIKVWSLTNGSLMRTLKGHTRAVRTLQFDDTKLVTGSMDHTLKIWNYHTGKCIRTLEGHTTGVVHLHFDSQILASGSIDGIIKIWNFQNGECFTLNAHTKAVNHVHVYQQSTRLLSCGDDHKLIIWDLQTRQPIRILEGHQSSVQAAIPSMNGFLHRFYESLNPSSLLKNNDHMLLSDNNNNNNNNNDTSNELLLKQQHRSGSPVVISCSLDNTLKVWSLETGNCLRTLFGHNQGIKSLIYDKLRLVSGSIDGELKIWDIENGQILHSSNIFNGVAINSVAISDTKIVSVSDEGDFHISDFGV